MHPRYVNSSLVKLEATISYSSANHDLHPGRHQAVGRDERRPASARAALRTPEAFPRLGPAGGRPGRSPLRHSELPAELYRGGVCLTTTSSRRHPTPPGATQRRLTTPNATFGSQMARFARPYCATEPVRTVPFFNLYDDIQISQLGAYNDRFQRDMQAPLTGFMPESSRTPRSDPGSPEEVGGGLPSHNI